MKPTGVLVLFAIVVLYGQASAQQGKGLGRCPNADGVFGICVFDPQVNCLEDSACKGGQLCCPHGCNKICKDPVHDDGYLPPKQEDQGLVVKQCPKSSGGFGICVFDESKNCLEDNQCKTGQLCCQEGCNKVCKEPVTFQPLKPQPKLPLN